jgi:hypothetical protein
LTFVTGLLSFSVLKSGIEDARSNIMPLTTQQADRLKRAYAEIGTVLQEAGIVARLPRPPADPKWLTDTAKQWGLLSDFSANHSGDLAAGGWSRLGRQHGYDPRGLGGFFVGKQPLMSSDGDRRVLTDRGHRFIERWRGDFE